MKGLFITFEGTDGAGKTTQMQRLAQRLQAQCRAVLLSREPGGCPIAEQIRTVLLDPQNMAMSPVTEALLYAAARSQHVYEVIRPALQRGDIVLCDRFLDSSLAYQAYGRGLGEDLVRRINEPALDGLQPDLTFYLALGAASSLRRSEKRSAPDRLELAGLDLQQKVSLAYGMLAQRESDRIVVVDAAQSIERIHEHIWQAVLRKTQGF
ncbi:MAG: dTMP kinase [Eubacteriales bacterium]|nr:dTMP kinase [Eubacteriales bacterium]